MTWTLCTSGAAIAKAGLNANSTIIASGTYLAGLSDEAESLICDSVRVDVVTGFAGYTTNGKLILQSLASNIIAQKIVAYDMSGYTSRAEAQTILDVLENSIRRELNLIENDRIKTYLQIT